MLDLGLIAWLTLFTALVVFWWHSDAVKNEALKLVDSYCKRLGLQLLDQSMVINSVWPATDQSGTYRLKRKYRFEFTSTGEQRYRGSIVMIGRNQHSIKLDPHVLPTTEQNLE